MGLGTPTYGTAILSGYSFMCPPAVLVWREAATSEDFVSVDRNSLPAGGFILKTFEKILIQ